MNVRLTVLLLLFTLAIIAIFVVTITLVQNPRQLSRRIFRQFTPCAFGTGTKFEIVEKINDRTEPVNLIFAVSLFGKYSETFKARYVEPLFKLIKNVEEKLPEAQVRVYLAQNMPTSIKEDLVKAKAEVFIVTPEPKGFEATLWRFFAADDPLPFLSIDADDNDFDQSYVNQVKKWLQSDKKFFIIRHKWFLVLPMTAGRWGAKPGAFGDVKIQALTEKYCDNSFGVDEGFLNRELWPTVKESVETSGVDPEEVGIIVGVILIVALFLVLLYYTITSCFCKKSSTPTDASQSKASETTNAQHADTNFNKSKLSKLS